MNSQMKRYIGRDLGGSYPREAGVCQPPGVGVFASREAFHTPYCWDFMEVSKCRHDQLLTLLLAPLHSLESEEQG